MPHDPVCIQRGSIGNEDGGKPTELMGASIGSCREYRKVAWQRTARLPGSPDFAGRHGSSGYAMHALPATHSRPVAARRQCARRDQPAGLERGTPARSGSSAKACVSTRAAG